LAPERDPERRIGQLLDRKEKAEVPVGLEDVVKSLASIETSVNQLDCQHLIVKAGAPEESD
jgi:hypothetical protein